MNFLTLLCCARVLLASPIGTQSSQAPASETSHAPVPTPSHELVVDRNTVFEDEIQLDWDGVLVNKPYNLSIRDCGLLTLLGDVQIRGDMYIKAEKESMALHATPHAFNNSGVFVFESTGRGQWSSVYLRAMEYLENTGEIKLFTQDPEFNAPFEVQGAKFSNHGVISTFRPTHVRTGNLDLYSLSSSPTVFNEGSICLHNVNALQLSRMHGSGCISLHAGSEYSIRGTSENNGFPWDHNQQVALFDNSTLSIDGLYDTWKGRSFEILGFGADNRIHMRNSVSQNDLVYNEEKGIVHWSSLNRPSLHIGQGYNASKLIVEDSVLRYDGPVPDNTIPSVCMCDFSIPTFDV